MSDLHPRLADLDPDALARLRARTAEIARPSRGAGAASEGEGEELLLLESRGQRFALPLSSVLAVADVSSVATLPRAPAFVRGLISHRAELLVAIELALVVAPAGGVADLRKVAILDGGAGRLALLVERGLSIATAPRSSFHPLGAGSAPFLVGTDRELVTLIDPAELVATVFARLRSGG